MPPDGPKQSQPAELLPDAAGLEPLADGAAGTADTERQRTPHPRPGAARKSWVDHPINVRIIMALALPSVVEQLISAAIGLTDLVVAGHTGDNDGTRAASAAAVSAMTYLQWFGGLMTSALGVGATAIVARAIGAGRPRMANRVAGTACAAAFLVGLVVALMFYFGAGAFARLFGLQGESLDLAVQYLQIMSWTICLQTFGGIGTSCLRGAGDTVRPLMVTIAICIMNGIASPALTFGWWGLPAWGVRGNATGTLLAFAVSGVFTVAFLLKGNAGLRLRASHFKIVPHLLVRVVKIGLPSWLESMLLWFGQAAVVALVMKPVDDALAAIAHDARDGVTMAAHGATLRIESLAFLPGFGFGIACSALVGQYLGAKKPQEAERSAVLCNRLALLTMTVAAVPMIVIPQFLLRLLVDSERVVQLGIIPLILAGLAQPAFAVAIVKSQALKGAGETVAPMWTTISGMVGRVVLIVLLMLAATMMGHPAWGLNIVWIGIFLDLGYRGLVMELVFRRGKWKTKRV